MLKRNLSILVVDDEPVLRNMVACILAEDQVTVTEAASGNQGLELIKRCQFDVVLSDVRMPDGSGVDLLRGVASMPGDRPPVIMMTGYSEFSRDDLRQIGAFEVLPKPIDFDRLSELISEAVSVSEARV